MMVFFLVLMSYQIFTFRIRLQKTDITVSTSGRGNIILADILLHAHTYRVMRCSTCFFFLLFNIMLDDYIMRMLKCAFYLQICQLHSSGRVHIVDRSYNVQTFVAYEGVRVTHMKQMKQKNILLTIGVRSLINYSTKKKKFFLQFIKSHS